MIIYPDKCIYKSYVQYLEWMDLTIPKYLEGLDCIRCEGQRICQISLEQLILEHECELPPYK